MAWRPHAPGMSLKTGSNLKIREKRESVKEGYLTSSMWDRFKKIKDKAKAKNQIKLYAQTS